MVQCEMCGTETGSPTTAKIEGAELQVCDSCASFGTEISSADTSTTTSKYSTSDTGTSSTTGTQSPSPSTGQGASSRHSGPDMFDEMDTLSDDYPERIRDARESRGMSQEELANELNEKASLIRKLERGDMQPNDAVQSKLERKLNISLTAGDSDDDAEWDNEINPGEMTLGDVVRRGE